VDSGMRGVRMFKCKKIRNPVMPECRGNNTKIIHRGLINNKNKKMTTDTGKKWIRAM
jgi:hypothetical protein